MNKQILDEDLIERNPKQEEKDFRIQVVFAVGLAAFLYLIILIIFSESVSIDNIFHYTIVEDSLSIIHLLIAATYMNFVINKGDYKLNVKAGYYILVLGSGFFFIGAIISLIDGLYEYLSEGLLLREFWIVNYKHIITLGVIFVKFLLIKPIAFLLTKMSKDVSKNR